MSDQALSPVAIRRHVLACALRHPLTLTGGACVMVAIGATALTGALLAWLTLAVLTVGTVGHVTFQSRVRRDTHVRAYLTAMESAEERERLVQLGAIRARLFDMAQRGVGAGEAGRALEQYQRLHRHHASFGAILERKLNVGELTWVRYVSAADAACRAVMANLGRIADRLEIARDGHRDALEAVEAELARNDAAVTALAETATAVAGMRDLEEVGNERLDAIIDDLATLTLRAARSD